MSGYPNPIHGIKRKAFHEKKWFVELFAAVPPALAAGWAAWGSYKKDDTTAFVVLLLGALWLIAAAGLKIAHVKATDVRDDLAKSHDGLLAALNVLHATVAHAAKLTDENRFSSLRVTFHRVVPPLNDSQLIEQIVPYVGGSQKGQGRTFSIRSGITGCSIRENEPYVMDRQSESFQDYVTELVREWNYTSADAQKMTMDRFSAMAVPVQGRGQDVLGVVYLDSSVKSFFATDNVQDAVIGGCAGIAKYIGERYV